MLDRLRPQTAFADTGVSTLNARSLAGGSQTSSPSRRTSHSKRQSRGSVSFGAKPRIRSASDHLDGEPVTVLDLQAADVKDAVAGTCLWIYEQKQYEQWLRPRTDAEHILLLSGGLATGKSVIAKSIYKRLKGDKVVVPFFCQWDVARRNTIRAVIATFVYYLLWHKPNLRKYVDAYRLSRAASLSFAELWSFFEDLTSDSSLAGATFIIDGMDQCSDSQRVLLDALKQRKSGMQARLLITSRNDYYARSLELVCPVVHLTSKANSDDAVAIFNAGIASTVMDKTHSQAWILAVRDRILSGIEGMLLVVEAKLRELDEAVEKSGYRSSPEFLEKLFAKPPRLLDAYFISVIRSGLSSYEDSLEDVIQTINLLVAVQKNGLDESELKHAMILSEMDCKTDDDLSNGLETVPDPIYRPLKVCGSIVNVKYAADGRPKSLQIGHPELKSFLTRHTESSTEDSFTRFVNHISAHQGHALLARACLRQLGLLGKRRLGPEAYAHYPLLLYSLNNWPLHVRESGDAVKQYSSLLANFLSGIVPGYQIWSNLMRTAAQDFPKMSQWWCAPIPVAVLLVREKLLDQLASAVGTGTPGFARILGGLEFDVNECDELGRAPLAIAIDNGLQAAAEKLLDLGADARLSELDAFTPLHVAVSRGSEIMVDRLLQHGASIDQGGKQSAQDRLMSPLHLSVHGEASIFEKLLAKSNHPLRRLNDGWTVLHEAVRNVKETMVTMILNRNVVEVDCRTKDGITPLMLAAGVSRSLGLTEKLIACGANTNQTTTAGAGPLYEAAYYDNHKIISFLLGHMADKECPKRGWTPLMVASFKGNYRSVDLLLEGGVAVNAKSDQGDTALIIAAREGRSIVVDQLLKKGADINAINAKGKNALLSSASVDDPKTFSRLLKASSDPTAASHFSQNTWTCLHAAATAGCYDNVRQIIEVRKSKSKLNEVYSKPEFGWTPLLTAIRHGQIKVAEELLEAGADTRIKSYTQYSALHMVCYYTKSVPLLERVLAEPWPNMLTETTNLGGNALLLAAEKGFDDAVKILVTRMAANTLVRNVLGRTPLYFAANTASTESLEILLKADYLPDIRSRFGWTALHAACQRCPATVIRKLAPETNWTVPPRVGLAPVHIAIQNSNEAAFFAMLEEGLTPKCASEWGASPLHEAAASGIEVFVDALLEREHDLEGFDSENLIPLQNAYPFANISMIQKLRPHAAHKMRRSTLTLDTLLHGAATVSRHELEWVLGLGMPAATRNAHNETALSLACESGREDVVDCLLRHSDAWELTQTKILLLGWTALHIAARFRQVECILTIAKYYDLEPNVRDCFGLTAFDYASGHVDTWLALVDSYPMVKPAYRRMWTEADVEIQQQIDAHRICDIARWRLNTLSTENNQFDEADGRLAAHALVDPFLRFQDDDNAQTAIEITLGRPYFRLAPDIRCHQCSRTNNRQMSVCKACPFRLLCGECKARSQQQSLRGCFRHRFLTAPSEKWFASDTRYLPKDRGKENAWLEQVIAKYSRLVNDAALESLEDSLFLDESTNFDVLNSLLSEPDLRKLTRHFRRHPRDILARDAQETGLVSHVISNSVDDVVCQRKLQILAEHGSRMLVFDGRQKSSIWLACEKGFEQSATFLLAHWAPVFDCAGDPFATKALEVIISKQWRDALSFAIHRHFRWATSDNNDNLRLRHLSKLGLPAEVIIDVLSSRSEHSETAPSTPTSETPWLPCFPPQLRFDAIRNNNHFPGCVHSTIRLQMPSFDFEEFEAPFAELKLPSEYTDIYNEDDGDAWLRSDDPPPPELLEQGDRDWPFESDSTSIILQREGPDLSQAGSMDAVDPRDATDAAMVYCGLGGVHPDSDVDIKVQVIDDRMPEVGISYRSSADNVAHGLRNALNMLSAACEGLYKAIGTAQAARLCCSSFSIAYSSALDTYNEHPIVQLRSISLALVLELIDEVRKTVKEPSPSIIVMRKNLQDCGRRALPLLQKFDCGSLYLEDVNTTNLHWCALALQLSCLGFVSFLSAHRSSIRSPNTKSHIRHFSIHGFGHDEVMRLVPVKMACIGDLLQDELNVFCPDYTTAASSQLPAYLSTCLEQIMELWGPSVCVGDRTDSGQLTGRIAYVYMRHGFLALTGQMEGSRSIAHWELREKQPETAHTMAKDDELLIGGGLKWNQRRCSFDSNASWYSNRNRLEVLNTKSEKWIRSSIGTGAAFTPPYFQFNVMQNHTRDARHTRKQDLLSRWAEGKESLHDLNEPFGISLSLCTGLAQRVPLRIVISEVLREYIQGVPSLAFDSNLNSQELNQIQRYLYWLLRGADRTNTKDANEEVAFQFNRLRNTPRQWSYVRRIIDVILEDLQWTGYNARDDKFQVAWANFNDPIRGFRLACHGTKHRWLRMMEDDRDIATFAVATGKCLVAHHFDKFPYGPDSCRCSRHSTVSETDVQLLHTRISIRDTEADVSSLGANWTLMQNRWYSFQLSDGRKFSGRLTIFNLPNSAMLRVIVIFKPGDELPKKFRKVLNGEKTADVRETLLVTLHHTSTVRGVEEVSLSSSADFNRLKLRSEQYW